MSYDISHADAVDCYERWPTPSVIISDGAYGIGGFPTDTNNISDLTQWYRPHVERWSVHAGPHTTLWFWNTERGWAEVHPLLEQHGWQYRGANIWNKGIEHVSGNTNTETIRKFPVVTEMCVQYVRDREAVFGIRDENQDVQQWMRDEWKRAGLTFQEANDVCGVASAATRKWFAADDKWYFPPPKMFEKLRQYANTHGNPDGRPYLASESVPEYDRTTFDCPAGVTNVWDHPPVHGNARISLPSGISHPNQKPTELMERVISVSSTVNDVVWEPFGGLCTATFVAQKTGRRGYAAEIEREYVEAARERLADTVVSDRQTVSE